MPVALQIRDVPEAVRTTIAARAAELGQSMQSYLLDMVQREARMVHNIEVINSTALSRVAIPEELDPVSIIREGRELGFDADRTET